MRMNALPRLRLSRLSWTRVIFYIVQKTKGEVRFRTRRDGLNERSEPVNPVTVRRLRKRLGK
jgi:hypothetical protein